MMKPTTRNAYKLLHEGSIALSQVEANGMRIDMDYLSKTLKDTRGKVEQYEKKLKESRIGRMWKTVHGSSTKWSSRQQLADLLFGKLGYNCPAYTPTGKFKADEEVLLSVDIPFVRNYLRFQKLQKLLNTYLLGIARETVDGYLRPSFNLHTVKSYRSSSDSPNFQNLPIRDPKAGKLIRRCFIPREGHRLVEIDYSGIEVRIAACYHKDPTMLAYIEDPTKDMHRDMAAEIFLCDKEDVSKVMRYYAKNQFVFPQFYGSYWLQCAQNLWEIIENKDLEVGKVTQKVDLKIWLKNRGIKRLGSTDPDVGSKKGSFVHHIRGIERDFWDNRFPVYAEWKTRWYGLYCKHGWFEHLTGFRESGYYKRNDVINHPVQGAAFHCLLWSLIRIQKYLQVSKMKTKIIGQIHDSIVADVHADEMEDYLHNSKVIMTELIRHEWPWIIVPLEVEAEACDLGETWFDKRKVEI